MTRAVAYQGYVGNFQNSKQRPKPMDVWWPIGEKKTSSISEEQKRAFLKAREIYLKKKEQKDG